MKTLATRLPATLALAALLLQTRPLVAQAQAQAVSPPEVSAPVSRMTADVQFLAGTELKGRKAGTPEADKAAAYIASSFKKIGLVPGAGASSYLQTFDFIDGVTLGPKNALVTSGGAEVGRTWSIDLEYRPMAFSTAGAVSGEAVFAGYGITAKDLDYDDYAGLDVKGKIAVILRYGPDGDDSKSPFSQYMALRYKASQARQNGAAAVVFVTGPRTKDVGDDLVALRTDASFTDAGLIAVSVKRPVAESIFRASGRTLEEIQKAIDEKKKPASFAIANARIDITADVTPRRVKTSNVLGVLVGSDPLLNKEFVVVGAHYDHLGLGGPGSLEPSPEGKIHHGADDNASGVSLLLELARALSAKRTELKRSVLFISFAAEEIGTLGSLHFTKNPTVPLDKIAAMVNLDMVGRLRNDSLDVHGTGTSSAWPAIVEKANQAAGLKLKFQKGGFGPSDHSPFYAAGRPVLFLFTGAHAEYHRPSDTADRINYAGQERILGFLQPVISEVASAPEPVPFTKVAGETQPQPGGGRSRGVWVGTIPDFSEEKPGVRVSGTTPGSPAEKAGILAGDLLVKFAGKELRNLYDYTYALQDVKPGDKVIVEVKRMEGGAEVTKSIEVTVAARPSANK